MFLLSEPLSITHQRKASKGFLQKDKNRAKNICIWLYSIKAGGKSKGIIKHNK